MQAGGDVSVTIESQNMQDTMMHTSSVLYEGSADGASFTVPEDSMVVYFNFSADQTTALESAAYQGEAGSGSVPLGYKLLPGFIANRMQGLRANQNAIQRLVFFQDGMKLFRQSPILGLGLGGFQNNVYSVQDFYYTTKYIHNHYIQALVGHGHHRLCGLCGHAAAARRRRGPGPAAAGRRSPSSLLWGRPWCSWPSTAAWRWCSPAAISCPSPWGSSP